MLLQREILLDMWDTRVTSSSVIKFPDGNLGQATNFFIPSQALLRIRIHIPASNCEIPFSPGRFPFLPSSMKTSAITEAYYLNIASK